MSDLKPGDMVQVWDWKSGETVANRLMLHGKIGYVIKDQTYDGAPGLL